MPNEITIQNSLEEVFPDWYVSLSFSKSSSSNYSKAVAIAKMAPNYIKSLDEGGNLIHQAVYSHKGNEYLAFVALYEMISTWKSCIVIINGIIIDRKIVGKLNYCYGDNIRSGDPNFCFGASQATVNPFGCHRLQISVFNNPWWTFGHMADDGLWYIDKLALKNRIMSYSTPYQHCPSFSLERILQVLNDLPYFIDFKKDRKWIIIDGRLELKNNGLPENVGLSLTLKGTTLSERVKDFKSHFFRFFKK